MVRAGPRRRGRTDAGRRAAASASPDGRVLDELLVPRGAAADLPGTTYREFTTTLSDPRGGPLRGDVVEVDLTSPAVRVDLLTPPVVPAVATVPELAGRAGAIAAVNGGFFDEGGTGAPVGAEIVDGAARTSGVPVGRRPSPPAPPGQGPDTVVGLDGEGRAHLARVAFRGSVVARDRTVPLAGLDGYAVPVDGVGVFDPAWGDAPRGPTTCGSDTDPDAPCSADTLEVRVARGEVVAVGPPGAGRLPDGTVALVGRDRGAASLRGLTVGMSVRLSYGLGAVGSPPLRVALGALPLARGGDVLPGLQDTERAPRTAVGMSSDGSRLWLVTVDGRQDASIGVTLAELARLLTDLGAPVAASLDGGGSTTMVRRGRDEGLTIVNDPAADPLRAVTDSLAVLPR
ncbi:phosphodiester glycosidase family protein [Actinomycetospora succinea]|uniref:phosphodiester glycosidase family protein n=1 Tax=Actinomycetospora succinea TaxID=663603 RepID=UPI00105FF747|nr:phosphodiester glycosidase family protein [Actinomycetospora succinea]